MTSPPILQPGPDLPTAVPSSPGAQKPLFDPLSVVRAGEVPAHVLRGTSEVGADFAAGFDPATDAQALAEAAALEAELEAGLGAAPAAELQATLGAELEADLVRDLEMHLAGPAGREPAEPAGAFEISDVRRRR
ncbi:MAG TPA: hypothetical protein VES03_05580 [Motilibacterales bacterium]|nr:hypothetical protein [Motilibacterales bacterium]